jgi:hypothetical protein
MPAPPPPANSPDWPRSGPGSQHRHGHKAAADAYHHHHEVAVAAFGYQSRPRTTTPPYPDQAQKGPDLGLEGHAAPALVANCRRTQLQQAATAVRILAVAQPTSAEPPEETAPSDPPRSRGRESRRRRHRKGFARRHTPAAAGGERAHGRAWPEKSGGRPGRPRGGDGSGGLSNSSSGPNVPQ